MGPSPIATRPSVFIDSSVFFAAAYSVTGSAHDLFQAALQDQVVLVPSDYVLTETGRNLLENAPRAPPAFLRLCSSFPHQLASPSHDVVVEAAAVVVAKDAPNIAAAHAANVDFVATYDCKDLLSHRHAIYEAFGLTVVTPEEVLRALSSHR